MTAPCRNVDIVSFSEPGGPALYRYGSLKLTIRVRLLFLEYFFFSLVGTLGLFPLRQVAPVKWFTLYSLVGYFRPFCCHQRLTKPCACVRVRWKDRSHTRKSECRPAIALFWIWHQVKCAGDSSNRDQSESQNGFENRIWILPWSGSDLIVNRFKSEAISFYETVINNDVMFIQMKWAATNCLIIATCSGSIVQISYTNKVIRGVFWAQAVRAQLWVWHGNKKPYLFILSRHQISK